MDLNKWSYTFFGGYGTNRYNGIQEDRTELMNISDSYVHRTLVNKMPFCAIISNMRNLR